MLTLNNWRLEVPECRRSIGYEGENKARRLEIQTDIGPEWSCWLCMEYSNGTITALPLERSGDVLRAELTLPYLSIPGPVQANLRAQNGDVVRKSNLVTLYVAPAVGEEAGEIPPEVYEQILTELEKKGDALGYTEDGDLGLWARGKLLSAVPIAGGGGGEGGTADHRLLTHRDAERQHPIEAIDGLEKELKKIPAPVEALTNLELEELLK